MARKGVRPIDSPAGDIAESNPALFSPQYLYLFSRQGIFPSKSGRLQKTSDPLDDFVIDWDRTSQIPAMGHVTVIQKGISFYRSKRDELPGPIYAVN